jgi:non-specific serine/threonine protein kinase
MRFRLLETVREYGIERLEASGEAESIRAGHAAYCLVLVRQIDADPDEVARADRLEREHDNVRAALRWAREGGDLRLALLLAAALRRFWWRRGYLSEGRRWLAELLARAEHDPRVRDTSEWATALGAAGYLAWAQADYATALAYHRAALDRWAQLREPRGVAAAQGFLATTLCWQGDSGAARPLLEQSLAGWRALGHAVGAGNALFQLGLVALFERRFEEADDLLRQALVLHEAARSANDAAYDLVMIGYVAVQRGRPGEARRRLAGARELLSQLDDHWGVLFLLECAAALAAAEGDARRSLRLVGVSSALRDRTGARLPPVFRDCFAPWLLAARRSLPETEAEAATRSGRSFAPGQAIDPEQLRVLLTDAPPRGAAGGRALPPLTRREQEIAACVARGWTNDQIATSLVVSRRTVESHVSHILGKLGFSTRAQLAVWVTQHGPTEPPPT